MPVPSLPRPLWPSWSPLRRRVASATHLSLFLDYDGTLVPLVDHPSRARLSPAMKRLLQRLAGRPGVWVALVSGRSLADVKRMVGLAGLCYVGNHGLELQGPALRYVNPVARATRPLLAHLGGRLTQALASIPGAWVEDKALTLSVHYRRVAAVERLRVRNAFYQVVRPSQEQRRIRVTAGKDVFELRPPVRWTKGTMLSWLLTRQRALAGRASVLPVCLGDDATDEDAFEALGDRGITVAVGPSTPLTRARYYVKSPADVQRLLERILAARPPSSALRASERRFHPHADSDG